MPRGNPDNLLKKDDLTPEQRRINASKAGKAAAEKAAAEKAAAIEWPLSKRELDIIAALN